MLSYILKRKPIERIFFSVDIDALSDYRQGVIYSAFDYSILHSILYLSLLSSRQVQKYECLFTALVSLVGISNPKRRPSTRVRIRNPYKPGFNTVNESGMTPFKYCDAIQAVAKISKKMGLKIGLGSCIGEVVELMGPDWKGKTTNATVQIINSLQNLS